MKPYEINQIEATANLFLGNGTPGKPGMIKIEWS
jgi:hypothetical protein